MKTKIDKRIEKKERKSNIDYDRNYHYYTSVVSVYGYTLSVCYIVQNKLQIQSIILYNRTGSKTMSIDDY